MEIKELKYGESVLPESMCFTGGDKNKFREIVFKVYLVKDKEKLILVDAGCETMPGFVMKNFIGTVSALEKINVSPQKVTDVIITHSHHDHIECVKYFKNAIIHIEKNEYESGKKYLSENLCLNIFENKFSVSENVEIIKIGGHSDGSCIVEIKKEDEIYVVAGDECYVRECLSKKIITGSTSDKDASRYFIEKYSAPEYKVLLCHDE